MNKAAERLESLRVADCMQQHVVTVRAGQTMPEAAETLLAHEISGAPVVDETGRCVGMLSAHDFLKRERNLRGEESPCGQCGPGHALVQEHSRQPLHLEEARDDLVSCHMTPAVQEISSSVRLLTAARVMCAMHIHRLPVLSPRGVPVGMLTSLDVVSALVNAMEEGR